jgi:DNA replication protein DnaC
MTAMPLKNPPEPVHSIADLAQSTLAALRAKSSPPPSPACGPAPSPLSRPFVAQYGACATHGQYPLNMQDAHGGERWYPQGCPVCHRQAQAARLLEASNIPKRFADCDFGNYEASTEEQQRVLRRCESYASEFGKYRDAGACLLLCGRPGTGKNHLATAISRRLLQDGYCVLRIKASQYLDAYWSKSFDEREAWLKGMAAVDLLMMDEIGRSSNAKSAQDAFFRLLDARYEAQLPNLLATNLNREDLIEVLGEATYDRLTQGGSIRLTFDWDSYRAKKVGV